MELSRSVFPTLRSHKLNIIANHLNVDLLNHHRAVDDAKATAEILLKIFDLLKEKGITSFKDINQLNENRDFTKLETFHVVLLAKNLTGLKNLYRLVSESHINYFHRRPEYQRPY